jgi:hypothetical protein
MESDPRKGFIIKNLESLLNVPISSLNGIEHSSELDLFLNDLNVKSVQIVVGSSGEFKIHTDRMEDIDEYMKEVHFIKRGSGNLTESNIEKQVIAGSLKGNALTSLFQTMENVYLPLLAQQTGENSQIQDQLKNLMHDLSAGLSMSLKKRSLISTSDRNVILLSFYS